MYVSTFASHLKCTFSVPYFPRMVPKRQENKLKPSKENSIVFYIRMEKEPVGKRIKRKKQNSRMTLQQPLLYPLIHYL